LSRYCLMSSLQHPQQHQVDILFQHRLTMWRYSRTRKILQTFGRSFFFSPGTFGNWVKWRVLPTFWLGFKSYLYLLFSVFLTSSVLHAQFLCWTCEEWLKLKACESKLKCHIKNLWSLWILWGALMLTLNRLIKIQSQFQNLQQVR
jgi:hypothetical protein